MPNFVNPSRLLDVGVKPVSFDEYQQEAQKQGLAQALAQAQIMAQQAAVKKAMQPEKLDIEDLGKQAFVKAATGQPITAEEGAALQYLDSKSQNYSFNPVTGNLEQKPSLLDRAGVGAQVTPPPRNVSPAQARSMPTMSNNLVQAGTPEGDAAMVELFGGKSKDATPQDNYDAAMQAELAKAAGNPKMQQEIKLKYVTTPEQIFTRENTLRDEFTNTTKDFRTIQDAYSKISSTSDSAAGDLSLLYQYNKLLDPGSVVRESEFATVASSGSLGQRLQGAAQRLLSGERLTPEQRQAFKEEAGRIYESQNQSYDRVKGIYKGLAERNRVNPQNVITDYAQPKQPIITAAPRNASDRKAGAVYSTPSGNLKWTGTGWIPAN